MMGRNLSFSVCTKRVLGVVGDGSSAQVCDEIDVSGYDGVRFVALMGKTAEGGTASLFVEGADVSGQYSADQGGRVLAKSGDVVPGSDDGKLVIVDIHRPLKRFLRASVGRGVANSSIDGVIAELYCAESKPVEVDSKVARQVVV
jgi:hypothetical protein